jgi:NitT/TauT family transport system permease protein
MTSNAESGRSRETGVLTLRGVRARSNRGARRASRRSGIIAVLSVVVGIVLWQVLGTYVLNPLFLPAPTAIWDRFLELVHEGVRGVTLGQDIAASSQSYFAGLGLAIVIGGVVGIAMAASRTIRDILDPWVAVLNATPTIALAPIFILVFGLGITSKIAVCTLVMVFPILVNTYSGFANTDASLVEAARSFGANGRQVYAKVKLPMAVPYLIAALRLAAGHGLVGVVVSELFGAKAGVGLLIMNSANTFDSRGLFVGIIMLGAAGTIITYALLAIERRLGRWRRSEIGD